MKAGLTTEAVEANEHALQHLGNQKEAAEVSTAVRAFVDTKAVAVEVRLEGSMSGGPASLEESAAMGSQVVEEEAELLATDEGSCPTATMEVAHNVSQQADGEAKEDLGMMDLRQTRNPVKCLLHEAHEVQHGVQHVMTIPPPQRSRRRDLQSNPCSTQRPYQKTGC